MLSYNPKLPLFSLHIPKTAGISFENVLNAWFNNFRFPNLNNRPRLYDALAPSDLDFFFQRLLGCGLYYHYSNERVKRMPRKVPLGQPYGFFPKRSRPECVHGHFDPNTDGGDLFSFYPEATQFITFLRDPLEMQLSLFFYLKKLIESGGMYWNGEQLRKMEYDGDIDRWLEERDFYLLHFLPMNFNIGNYEAVINQHFVHVGVTEHMQRSVDILAEKLSLSKIRVPVKNKTERHIKASESSIKKFKAKHDLEYRIYDYVCSLNN